MHYSILVSKKINDDVLFQLFDVNYGKLAPPILATYPLKFLTNVITFQSGSLNWGGEGEVKGSGLGILCI